MRMEKSKFSWDSPRMIKIEINMSWSDWFDWESLEKGKIELPGNSGVYEVRSNNLNECYDICMVENIKEGITKGLILGKMPNSTRRMMIKDGINLKELKVRWCECENSPAALEEYLHIAYIVKFNKLPKYVNHTSFSFYKKK